MLFVKITKYLLFSNTAKQALHSVNLSREFQRFSYNCYYNYFTDCNSTW